MNSTFWALYDTMNIMPFDPFNHLLENSTSVSHWLIMGEDAQWAVSHISHNDSNADFKET